MANKPGRVNTILREMQQIIEEGKEWGQSGIIPPRTQLAKRYKVSTSTINDVMSLLHAQGYVMAQGRNVVVNPNRFVLPVLVPSFDKYLKERGLTPYMVNVGAPDVVELSEDLAAAFDLPAGTKAARRLRVQGEKRNGSHIPYRLAETFYLVELVEPYLEQIKNDPLFVGIDAIKRDTGKVIAKSAAKVLTRFPTEAEQEQLHITLNTPVNELFRRSLTQDGELIMFSRIVSPGYRFALTFEATTQL